MIFWVFSLESLCSLLVCMSVTLEGEQEEESHHKTEQTHGLGQGESKNGVGEKLLLEGRVPGVADDQGAEHGSNSSSGASNSDSGSASTNEFGSRVNVVLLGSGLNSPGLGDGSLSQKGSLPQHLVGGGGDGKPGDGRHDEYLV